MIKELIEEGEVLKEEKNKELENLDKKGTYYANVSRLEARTMISDSFNNWATKLVDYLEGQYSNQAIVKDIMDSYFLLNHDTSKEFYDRAMSVLYTLDTN